MSSNPYLRLSIAHLTALWTRECYRHAGDIIACTDDHDRLTDASIIPEGSYSHKGSLITINSLQP